MLRPRIFQVEPNPDFTVNVFFDDGTVKIYDANPLIEKGGIYTLLGDLNFFINRCVIMNNTLAWDVPGNWDSTECIDICPDLIYEQSTITQTQSPAAPGHIPG